jgi:hypothetical protein
VPPSLTVPTALPITPTHHFVTGSSATLRSADALEARGERGGVGEVDPSFVSVAAGREGYGEITTARYVSPDERENEVEASRRWW